MPGKNSANNCNLLLNGLPRATQRRLLSDCTPVVLHAGAVLATAGERISHVYFPTRGCVSQTLPVDGMAWLGIGLIGDEGMLGIHIVLGIDISPVNATVFGESAALRMETSIFCRQLGSNGGLLPALNRYCHVQFIQLAQASSCNRFHPVVERLARRLLMTQDRAHSERFHVTQQALAELLGVRRPAVNVAASALQEQGLIHYRRGAMKILDRVGLEALACSCYAADKAIYSGTMQRT